MKTDKKLNVRLLRKVQKHILDQPTRLKMRYWVDTGLTERKGKTMPPCGTAACIAGWVVLLSGKKISPFDGAGTIAIGLLNIDGEYGTGDVENSEASKLFNVGQWPLKFQLAYNRKIEDPFLQDPILPKLGDLKKNAEITAARIDHFIKYRE